MQSSAAIVSSPRRGSRNAAIASAFDSRRGPPSPRSTQSRRSCCAARRSRRSVGPCGPPAARHGHRRSGSGTPAARREPQPMRFFATRELVARDVAQAGDGEGVRGSGARALRQRHGGRAAGPRAPGDPLRLYRLEAFAPARRQSASRLRPRARRGSAGSSSHSTWTRSGATPSSRDRRWRVDLSPEAVTAGARYRPMVWGRPPQPPWGYARMPRPNEIVVCRSVDL